MIEPLACSLVGAEGAILPLPETLLAGIYGPGRASRAVSLLVRPGARLPPSAECRRLRAAALDDEGELRAVEMPAGEFWLATLYQPELSSPPGQPHPVIAAFVAAAGRPPYTS